MNYKEMIEITRGEYLAHQRRVTESALTELSSLVKEDIDHGFCDLNSFDNVWDYLINTVEQMKAIKGIGRDD